MMFSNKSISEAYEKAVEFSNKSLDERIDEFNRLKGKFNNKIPIIIRPTRFLKDNDIKIKYLVEPGLSVAQFNHIIRKNAKIEASQGIYIHFNNSTVPTPNTIFQQLENDNTSEDGFLYCSITLENTFG